MHKEILPEGFNFDVPAVEMIGVGSKGLDKSAMQKRASVFDDVLGSIEKKPNRTYLHVITTGALEKYFSNNNGDGWPGDYMTARFPEPEDPKVVTMDLDGGLKKYHDKTFMEDASVYQEHRTKRNGVDPSGEVVIARYNEPMSRGELIIAVDTEKWQPRLQRKANGQDLYLSIGADVPYDVCSVCGRKAKTMAQHCEHFNKHRCEICDDGTPVFVYNDAPSFYDISGVDVPADKIAFVLQKVASGASIPEAAAQAVLERPGRRAMLLNKAASILSKLSKMEKEVQGIVEADDDVFQDDEDEKEALLRATEGYPADEVIDACNRKAILLSPGMLFKLLGRDLPADEGVMLISCDDDSCGDCSTMMEDLEESPVCNEMLLDGSFDTMFPADLNLDSILERFIPELGVSRPALQGKSITIIIEGRPRHDILNKKSAFNKTAQEALRNTYARYLIGFAQRNDDDTCKNALRKIAAHK